MSYSGLVYWLIEGGLFGFLSMRIWTRKGGSPPLGFLIGFVLGLIGLIIVAVIKPPGIKGSGRWICPYCAQTVVPNATTCTSCGNTLPLRACPHCGYNTIATSDTCGACGRGSEPWKLHNGAWWKREHGVTYVYDTAEQRWLPQA